MLDNLAYALNEWSLTYENLIFSLTHYVLVLLHISPYSIRMRENADQNNFEYGHFLRSVLPSYKYQSIDLLY